ncbi:MAG: hypothetical protein ACREIA_01120 [Opitutaceae bacterium]
MRLNLAGFLVYLPNQMQSKSIRLLLGLSVLFSLAALAWVLPPDGQTRSRWLEFFGRLHPLVIHLPIGFILPAREGVGRSTLNVVLLVPSTQWNIV